MSLLRAESPNALVKAILSADMGTLTRIPGIGRKTAERLCFELRERLSKNFPVFSAEGVEIPPSPAENEVVEALIGLGFSRQEASSAVRSAMAQAGEKAREEEVLESALRLLNRIRGERR